MKQVHREDLKDLTPEQLDLKAEELRRELLQLRLRAATSQVVSFASDQRKLKRSIACVLTESNERRRRLS